jgi:hypothetical protein
MGIMEIWDIVIVMDEANSEGICIYQLDGKQTLDHACTPLDDGHETPRIAYSRFYMCN